MSKTSVIIIFVILATLAQNTQFLHSQQPYFRFISEAEDKDLLAGKAIIKPLRNMQKSSLASKSSVAIDIRTRLRDSRANYVSEVLALLPLQKEEDAQVTLAKLSNLLADIQNFVTIPYYSKRQQKVYPLFDKIIIISQNKTPTSMSALVNQHMEPFDMFKNRYQYQLQDNDSLIFTATNLEPLVYSYQKINALSTRAMSWDLYVYKQNTKMVFYGLGTVNALDFFGLFRDRIETSFLGRVEAFFTYLLERVR